MAKKLVSTIDLVEVGFKREFIYQVAHCKGSPVIWTPKRGKILFFEDEFYKFVRERFGGRQ